MSKRCWRKDHPDVKTNGRRGFFDVPYGTVSPAQKFDLWLPSKSDVPGRENGPFPVIVAIHGGGFSGGTKRREDMLLPMLNGLRKGYAVASVEYRMTDEVTFPDPVRDIKRAIRFLRANAAKLMIDPERIVTWGGSAGGYLTCMSAVFDGVTLFDDPTDPNLNVPAYIAGAVGWYSLTNCVTADYFLEMNSFVTSALYGDTPDVDNDYCFAEPVAEYTEFPFMNLPDSILRRFLGDYWSVDRAGFADPNTYINENTAPILLQHGTRDEIVPMQHSIEFAMNINHICGDNRAILELIPDAIHSSVLFETSQNINRVFNFIDSICGR